MPVIDARAQRVSAVVTYRLPNGDTFEVPDDNLCDHCTTPTLLMTGTSVVRFLHDDDCGSADATAHVISERTRRRMSERMWATAASDR